MIGRGRVGISGVEQWGRRVQWRVDLGLFYNCLNILTGLDGSLTRVILGEMGGRVVGSGLVCLVLGLFNFLGFDVLYNLDQV